MPSSSSTKAGKDRVDPLRDHGAGGKPLAQLKGIGPSLSAKLEKLGLRQLRDLWFHLPLRYEDRTSVVAIRDLQAGQKVQVEGRIEAVERGFRYRPQLRVAISDDSGATLVLRFIHFRAAQASQFQPGAWLRCFGDVRAGGIGFEMIHPSYQRIGDAERGRTADRLTPLYPLTDGVGQTLMTRLMKQALAVLPSDDQLELLPAEALASLQLPSLGAALRLVHSPPADVDVSALQAGIHPAQRRLAFEELLSHQLSLRRQRMSIRRHRGPALQPDQRLSASLESSLPFALTAAQQRVLSDIRTDLVATEPMLRLVQGDVGSGKTVVAALAALAAIESGRQVAVLAPTELLAEQHATSFEGWLTPLGVNVCRLSGRIKGKARASALASLAGEADLIVGTHALFQDGVVFRDLALVVIDEQHRFGVHQRLALRDKGLQGEARPHQLVMTATPIPRTLAMTAYADLDVSVIDELPPGRTPVQTVVVNAARREQVVERIRAACTEGRQAYWVCTLIEESEEIVAEAAEATHAALSTQMPELAVGLVHGRMKAADKQRVMQAFKDGELNLLVATTVIEVGVDVPNASLMLIENAERLGLSQLHQLRGRVGRGDVASTCVLLYQPPLSMNAKARLEVMRESNDGFVIAERDLELRGPGELLGTRQTGEAGFRIADLARDSDLLPDVQRAAEALLSESPARAEALIARWVGAAERFAEA